MISAQNYRGPAHVRIAYHRASFAKARAVLTKLLVVACHLAVLWLGIAAHAATDVLTNNYDHSRTGANLNEIVLNISNVTSETFGHVGSYAVDGQVFGQPLIATGIDIAHIGRHDALYITTANNFVYAFDANDVSATPLWQRSLTDLPNGNSASVTGILSTPVIDRTTNSIYVVAGLMEGADARFVLHALDLADGSDKHAEPIMIDGSVRVDDSSVSFQPSNRRIAVQRAGLAIAQNKVIVAFGGDFFEGWVFAYDKSNLKAPPAVFCTTCASRSKAISRVDYLDSTCTLLGPGGGIWQSGRGPVVDANGKVYFFTGNKQHVIKDGCIIPSSDNACAKCSADEGCVCKGNRSSKACRGPDACIAHGAKDSKVFDTNEALIQLDSGAGLKLTAWFRPENWNASGVNGLEFNDLDLGGSGPVLIPNTNRIIGGGKQGVMYVLDTTRSSASCLPSLSETCMPAPLQSFQIAPIPPPPKEFYRQILGGPVLWTRSKPQAGSRAYVWRQNDHLRSYTISNQFERCSDENPPPTTSHNCTSWAQSKEFIDHHPGGILTLSANGEEPASGIVWATTTTTAGGPGKLMAFKALPDPATPAELTKLWDSDDCSGDHIAIGSDFVPPTVANGKVYVATAANRVDVYGLIKTRECIRDSSPEQFGPMLR